MYEIISDINIFNASIKLSVLYENNYILIIIENYNNLKIQIVKLKKLIKKFFS